MMFIILYNWYIFGQSYQRRHAYTVVSSHKQSSFPRINSHEELTVLELEWN